MTEATQAPAQEEQAQEAPQEEQTQAPAQEPAAELVTPPFRSSYELGAQAFTDALAKVRESEAEHVEAQRVEAELRMQLEGATLNTAQKFAAIADNKAQAKTAARSLEVLLEQYQAE